MGSHVHSDICVKLCINNSIQKWVRGARGSVSMRDRAARSVANLVDFPLKLYTQKFRDSWLCDKELKDWLQVVETTAGKVAKCKFCGTLLRNHYGDLKNYTLSKKHKQNSKIVSTQPKLPFKSESEALVKKKEEARLALLAAHTSIRVVDHLSEKIEKRPRVSPSQMEILVDFLEANVDIAKGYTRSAQARQVSYRKWEEIAGILNSQGDGAVKNGKLWAKIRNILIALFTDCKFIILETATEPALVMLEADNINMANLELEVIPAAPATSTITSDFDNTQFRSDHTYTQSQPNSYSSEPQPPLGSVPSTQPLPSRSRRPRQRRPNSASYGCFAKNDQIYFRRSRYINQYGLLTFSTPKKDKERTQTSTR
ncbi:hypothetical protein EVAR_76563_1 [Eumeta japonica]|uniref:Regulatory protein zeste n=1 Tax=Eumeta variegata TaxID=151549 RepID=A0A4C1T7N3_EUMVA|nr:hypothetical protein EVAR_76563_1 [Eumeta japonica]